MSGSSRLHDAVQVVNVVSARDDVLSGNGENSGQASRNNFHDIQEVFTDAKDVAIFNCGRDGKVFMVDDSVSFGGIYREDGVHGWVYFLSIHCFHRHW